MKLLAILALLAALTAPATLTTITDSNGDRMTLTESCAEFVENSGYTFREFITNGMTATNEYREVC